MSTSAPHGEPERCCRTRNRRPRLSAGKVEPDWYFTTPFINRDSMRSRLDSTARGGPRPARLPDGLPYTSRTSATCSESLPRTEWVVPGSLCADAIRPSSAGAAWAPRTHVQGADTTDHSWSAPDVPASRPQKDRPQDHRSRHIPRRARCGSPRHGRKASPQGQGPCRYRPIHPTR